MPKRATVKKTKKNSKKRVTKSGNKRKTRSVNRNSKHLGGGSIIENLQPVIVIKNNSILKEKIADCYVFSMENKIYVLFQLYKGILSAFSSASKGMAKGVANAGIGTLAGVYSALTVSDKSEDVQALQQKSASYLLVEKLSKTLKEFLGGIGNDATLTGMGETMSYKAETIFFSYTIDQIDRKGQLDQYNRKEPIAFGRNTENASFDINDPSNWINEVNAGTTPSSFQYTLNDTPGFDKTIMDAVNTVQSNLKLQPLLPPPPPPQ